MSIVHQSRSTIRFFPLAGLQFWLLTTATSIGGMLVGLHTPKGTTVLIIPLLLIWRRVCSLAILKSQTILSALLCQFYIDLVLQLPVLISPWFAGGSTLIADILNSNRERPFSLILCSLQLPKFKRPYDNIFFFLFGSWVPGFQAQLLQSLSIS